MNHRQLVVIAAATAFLSAPSASPTASTMSFFITSAGPGDGAAMGGLEGADRHCARLAEAMGSANKTWRAYLSKTATRGGHIVNARDRIGAGPWFNAKGVMVAEDVAMLHGETHMLGKESSLNEKGEVVNGRGDTPNMHDILTGSMPDGRASSDTTDTTCANWSSNGAGSALVGHHDLQGGGARPTSWNSAHGSRGCSQANLQATGGNGLFYCFAI